MQDSMVDFIMGFLDLEEVLTDQAQITYDTLVEISKSFSWSFREHIAKVDPERRASRANYFTSGTLWLAEVLKLAGNLLKEGNTALFELGDATEGEMESKKEIISAHYEAASLIILGTSLMVSYLAVANVAEMFGEPEPVWKRKLGIAEYHAKKVFESTLKLNRSEMRKASSYIASLLPEFYKHLVKWQKDLREQYKQSNAVISAADWTFLVASVAEVGARLATITKGRGPPPTGGMVLLAGGTVAIRTATLTVSIERLQNIIRLIQIGALDETVIFAAMMASVSENSPASPSFKGGGGGGQGGRDRLPPTEEEKKKIKALEDDHEGANENGDENTARFAARDADSITRSEATKEGVKQPDVILKKQKGARELKVLGKNWIDVTSDNLHLKMQGDILKASQQLRTVPGKIREIVVKINNRNVTEAMIRKAMRKFRTGYSNELAGIRLYAFRYDGKMIWWGICK